MLGSMTFSSDKSTAMEDVAQSECSRNGMLVSWQPCWLKQMKILGAAVQEKWKRLDVAALSERVAVWSVARGVGTKVPLAVADRQTTLRRLCRSPFRVMKGGKDVRLLVKALPEVC